MRTTEHSYLVMETAFGLGALIRGRNGLLSSLLPGWGRDRISTEIQRRFPGAGEESRGLAKAARAFSRYFETGRISAGSVRLDLDRVGGLTRSVYEALLAVPPGETVTYAVLAARIGHPGAHRFVGTALSRNPLPIFVPCHRVVRSDGGMGGFSAPGGVSMKRRLLALEGAILNF